MTFRIYKQVCLNLALLVVLSVYTNCSPVGTTSGGTTSLDSKTPGETNSGAIESLEQQCFAAGSSTPENSMRRLSNREYVNTLKDLLSKYEYLPKFPAGSPLTNIWDKYLRVFPYGKPLADLIRNLPNQDPDDSLTTYNRIERSNTLVNRDHIAIWEKVAWEIQARLVSLPEGKDGANLANLRRIFGSCYQTTYTSPGLDACLKDFINSFGLRAFRRPLLPPSPAVPGVSEEYIGESETIFRAIRDLNLTSGKENFAAVVYYFLSSPQFFYLMESEGIEEDSELASGSGRTLLVDSYAMASRLSYFLTESMPDDELFELARNNQLSTPDQVNAAIDGLVSRQSVKVKSNFGNFLKDIWGLKSDVFNDSRVNRALALEIGIEGNAEANINPITELSTVRSAMNEEIQNMFFYYLYKTGSDARPVGKFSDVMSSELSFATHPKLAEIYGVPQWDGSSEPPLHLPGERKGVLTKAGILVSGDEINNPFRKGGLIYKHFLCREFSEGGPAIINPDLENIEDTANSGTYISTREQFEGLVGRNSSCMQCHSQLEPFGMPFEAFDSFGRPRHNVERIFNQQNPARHIASVPVQTAHSPIIGGDSVYVENPIQLIDHINSSREAEVCFARQLFRLAYARKDNPHDACLVKKMVEGGETSILDSLKNLASDPQFFRKKID